MNTRFHSGVTERRIASTRKVRETQLGREAVRQTVSQVLIRIHPSDELGQGLVGTLGVFLQKLEIRLEVPGLQIVLWHTGHDSQGRTTTLLLGPIRVGPDRLAESNTEIDDVDELSGSWLLVKSQEFNQALPHERAISLKSEAERTLNEVSGHKSAL